jgi:hypothetical protein
MEASHGIAEQQERFIWLAFVEKKSYAEIERELNLPRKLLSEWTRDLKGKWSVVSSIKKIHTSKDMKVDFKEFYDHLSKLNENKVCFYCGVTESQISELETLASLEGHQLTKRKRGKKLELDRKEPNVPYDDLTNLVYACYWCNNAKTDSFSHQEFLEVGKAIGNIWRKRLNK